MNARPDSDPVSLGRLIFAALGSRGPGLPLELWRQILGYIYQEYVDSSNPRAGSSLPFYGEANPATWRGEGLDSILSLAMASGAEHDIPTTAAREQLWQACGVRQVGLGTFVFDVVGRFVDRNTSHVWVDAKNRLLDFLTMLSHQRRTVYAEHIRTLNLDCRDPLAQRDDNGTWTTLEFPRLQTLCIEWGGEDEYEQTNPPFRAESFIRQAIRSPDGGVEIRNPTSIRLWDRVPSWEESQRPEIFSIRTFEALSQCIGLTELTLGFPRGSPLLWSDELWDLLGREAPLTALTLSFHKRPRMPVDFLELIGQISGLTRLSLSSLPNAPSGPGEDWVIVDGFGDLRELEIGRVLNEEVMSLMILHQAARLEVLRINVGPLVADALGWISGSELENLRELSMGVWLGEDDGFDELGDAEILELSKQSRELRVLRIVPLYRDDDDNEQSVDERDVRFSGFAAGVLPADNLTHAGIAAMARNLPQLRVLDFRARPTNPDHVPNVGIECEQLLIDLGTHCQHLETLNLYGAIDIEEFKHLLAGLDTLPAGFHTLRLLLLRDDDWDRYEHDYPFGVYEHFVRRLEIFGWFPNLRVRQSEIQVGRSYEDLCVETERQMDVDREEDEDDVLPWISYYQLDLWYSRWWKWMVLPDDTGFRW